MITSQGSPVPLLVSYLLFAHADIEHQVIVVAPWQALYQSTVLPHGVFDDASNNREVVGKLAKEPEMNSKSVMLRGKRSAASALPDCGLQVRSMIQNAVS